MLMINDVMALASNGCMHRFELPKDFSRMHRGDIVECSFCRAQATAGEVAWMLAGATIVNDIWCAQQNDQAILQQLAMAPVAGGVN